MKGFLPVIVVASSEASGLQKGSASYYCDGVADEVQINLALDAADAIDGALVMLTPGHFYLEDTLLIGDNTILQGCGPSTILEFAATVADKKMITNNTAYVHGVRHGTGNFNITLRDMLLNGDKDARDVGSDDTNTVNFNTTENLLIENLSVIDGWTGAIRTEFCTYVTIRNNYIINSGDDGIEINEETWYADCYGNTIIDAGQGKSYGSPNGIEVQDAAYHASVHDNNVYNALHAGVEVSSHTGGVACHDVSIVGNNINNCVWGIYLLGVTGDYASDISVVANKCYNDVASANYQLYAKWTKRVTWSANIVRTKYYAGSWGTFNQHHTIVGNVFYCLSAAANTYIGLQFGGDTEYVRVADNSIINFGFKGIQFTGNVTGFHVVDNTIHGCTNAVGRCISFDNPTSSKCRLDRNHLKGTHWSYDLSITTYDVLAAGWTEAWNEKDI
jgi:hypothetical protein